MSIRHASEEYTPTTIRMTREGTLWTFSIVRDGVQSVIPGTSYTVTEVSDIVELRMQAWAHSAPVSVAMDNFKLWTTDVTAETCAIPGGSIAGP